MMIDYKENLKKILSFYPHIYCSCDEINLNSIEKYARHVSIFYASYGDINNRFITYECGIKETLHIDISLDELSNMIDQIKRDEKLKEVIEIINNDRL